MTEQHWLQSAYPAAMVAFLGERITDERAECIVMACRGSVKRPWPFRVDDINWQELLREWCDRMVFNQDIEPKIICNIIRDIIPFKSIGYVEGGVLWLDRGYTKDHNHSHVWEPVDWLQWNDGAIPAMVEAMMNEDCGECTGSGIAEIGIYDDGESYSCPTCDNGRIPRAEPRWSDMLVIADALEEAGCSEPAILEHLRSERDGDRCPWCDGGGDELYMPSKRIELWDDSNMPICSHCNGTGRIKRRHWKGCWAVELLKGTP